MAKVTGPQRQISYTRLLGLLFCLAGFTVIGFGWNGMARVACPDCQLPYLLSGGATGIGLILFGVGLLVMAHIRSGQVALQGNLDRMAEAFTKVATSSNGSRPSGDGTVVAGKSTYHRPDCRVVKGKRDLSYVTAEAAEQGGLTPCRVCDPIRPDRPVEAPADGAVNPPPDQASAGSVTDESLTGVATAGQRDVEAERSGPA